MKYQYGLTQGRRDALHKQIAEYKLTTVRPERNKQLEESFNRYERENDTLEAALVFILLGVLAVLLMFL